MPIDFQELANESGSNKGFDFQAVADEGKLTPTPDTPPGGVGGIVQGAGEVFTDAAKRLTPKLEGYVSNVPEEYRGLGGNIKGIIAGGAATVAVPFARAVESVWPTKSTPGMDVFDTIKETIKGPIKGSKKLGTSPFFRESDMADLAKMGKQILESYDKQYPFRTKGLAAMDDVRNFAIENPLYFGLDAAMVASPLKAPMGAAAKTLAGPVGKVVDTAAMKAIPGYRNARLAGDFAKIVNEKEALSQKVARILDQAKKKVPQELRRQLMEGGERSNLEYAYNIQANPAARKALKTLNTISEFTSKAAQDLGAITPQESMIAKYGPGYRAMTGVPEEQLWKSPQFVQDYAQTSKKVGNTNTYFGHVSQKSLDAYTRRRNLRGLGGSMPKTVADAAEDIRPQAELTESDKLGMFKRRKTGDLEPWMSRDAFGLVQMRLDQVLQFEIIKDFLKHIQSHPGVPKSGKLVPVNLETMIRATAAGISDPDIAKEMLKAAKLPTEINVPPAIKGFLDEVTADITHPVSKLDNWLRQTVVYWTLGGNYGWALSQGVQNQLLTQARMWGPTNIAESIMANILAFHPKAKDILPANWTYQAFQGGADMSQVLPKGLAKYAETFDKYIMQPPFHIANTGDNVARRQGAMFMMLQAYKKAPLKTQDLIGDAFDIQARIRQLEHVSKNPELMRAIERDLNQWWGDYSRATLEEQRWLRNIFPFYPWMRQSAFIAMRMPAEAPFKTSLMNHTAQVSPNALQDPNQSQFMKEKGFIALRDPEGKPITSNAVKSMTEAFLFKNGPEFTARMALGMQPPLTPKMAAQYAKELKKAAKTPDRSLYIGKQSFNPLTAGPQWADQILGLANPEGKTEGLPFISPKFSIPAAGLGYDLSTLRKFNNPDQVRVSGKNDDPNTGKAQEIVRPPLSKIPFMELMPRPTQAVEQMLAGNKRPSPMTWFGNKTVAADMKGNPIYQSPFEQLLALITLKVTPEMMTGKEEKRIEKQQEVKFKRNRALQGFKKDPETGRFSRF